MRRLALALAAASLAACIAVPLPPHDPSEPALRWLAKDAGAASRAELLLRLGEPSLVGDADRVLAYSWHDPRLLVLLAGSAPGAVGGFMIEKEFDLVIQLDANGRLARYEVATTTGATGTGTACSAGGICVEGTGGFPPVPLADAARVEDRGHLLYERGASPEALEAVADACRLLVFPADVSPASVWVDGRLVGFAHRGGWIAATLAPGSHRAAVLSPVQGAFGTAEAANERVFECAGGSRVVLVQRVSGLLQITGGPLESWQQPPATPPGGWWRYLSVASPTQ